MGRRRRKQIRKAQPLDASLRETGSQNPFESVGAPGTAIYGGFPISKEKDVELQGQTRYTTYSNMLANTSIVAAGVRFFLNLVAKAAWTVEPVDDSPEAEQIAENVQMIMEDMITPWHRVVRRGAMYCFWGFSIQEWTAKRRDDGLVGYLDIESRAQVTIERWDVEDTGTIFGVLQRNPQTQEEIYIPRAKLIYLVDDTLNDSPEGLGLFRHLVKTARRLERYELLEAWGFETDLRGVPVARGPFTQLAAMQTSGKLTAAQVAALKAPMLEFIESHNRTPEMGMLLDSMPYQTTDERSTPSGVRQWDVELLQGSPTSAAEVAAAIERLNREMARVLGVESLLLGSGSTGSFALSRDKSVSFGLIVDSCLKEMKETFEKDFLDPLWQLNGWDEALKPSFKIEKVQYRDIEEITSALQQMAQAGAPLVLNDPAINELRGLLGLSEQPEQEEADLSLLGGDPFSEELPDPKKQETPNDPAELDEDDE